MNSSPEQSNQPSSDPVVNPEANPTKDAALVNPPKKQTRMVKIRAKTPIRIMRDGAEHIHVEGAVFEATEEEAKEFCDKKISIGYKDTFGQYEGNSLTEKQVVRAERVSK